MDSIGFYGSTTKYFQFSSLWKECREFRRKAQALPILRGCLKVENTFEAGNFDKDKVSGMHVNDECRSRTTNGDELGIFARRPCLS